MFKIEIKENRVVIPPEGKKAFHSNISLRNESKQKCLDFATEMAYGAGYHNPEAFGGDHHRNASEIFIDTLQGKLAELAVYNKLHSLGAAPDKLPDFGVWKRGIWEDCDFTFNEGKIKASVKSTKSFGNLLLLEKARYSESGEYLEPANGRNPILYDYTFLSRVTGIENPNPKEYKNLDDIKVEVTGFITHSNFLEIINNKQIIQKGTILGIPLIVDNYYICANNLQEINTFKI